MIRDEGYTFQVALRSCSKWLDHGELCKSGGLISRFFIIDAAFGKSC